MATRPLASVPRAAKAALAAALALQLLVHACWPARPAQARALPPPPSSAALQLAALGEPLAMSRLMMLYLQGFDDQPGVTLPLRALDYGNVRIWLARMLELDPRGQAPLLAASQVYSAVDDPARTRAMLEFVYANFSADPARRWPWLAHAALVARHRLHDLALARKYAAALRNAGAAVPPWARELEVFIAEDMNELDSARALIGGLLQGGQVSDPNELRFLERRLAEIAARQQAAAR